MRRAATTTACATVGARRSARRKQCTILRAPIARRLRFYAVDIALPDGTPVYAARAGLVIDLRHDAFLGAVDPTLLDQANVVEVLHDDGTIAVYAHLHWDSIRVRIGQQVARGEYLADSGNTGFTSGPHLHFAVWRNSDNGEIAVPIVFEGPGGIAVTPATAVALTAY
jgi:murein DD-endopeptidase MepM/ murein hydrolase activator NlpD